MTSIWLETALNDLFSKKTFVKGLSGATAAATSLGVFYPLDLLRTELQTERGYRKASNPIAELYRLFHENGLSGLYSGVLPNLATLSVSSFVYFYSFHGLKHIWPLVDQTARRDLVLAYLAGSINVLMTAPLWVASTRLKLRKPTSGSTHTKDSQTGQASPVNFQGHTTSGKSSYSKSNGSSNVPVPESLVGMLRYILRQDGILGLWQGTQYSLLLCLNPTINFMVYEAIKRYYLRLTDLQDIEGFVAFVIGALSKFLATILTYPLQVLQSRKRAQSDRSVVEFLRSTLKIQGISGLYRGMNAKLLQTVLMSAFTFLIFEKLVQIIFAAFGVKR